MRRVAIILASVVLALIESAAFADTPQRFDLSCTMTNLQTGQTVDDWLVHVDLAAAQWCDDDNRCDVSPQPLTVEPGKLWFHKQMIENTPLGVEVLNEYVDRSDGRLHETNEFGGVTRFIGEGPCSMLPYGSKPQNAF